MIMFCILGGQYLNITRVEFKVRTGLNYWSRQANLNITRVEFKDKIKLNLIRRKEI